MIQPPVAIEVDGQDVRVAVTILEWPALVVAAGQFGAMDPLPLCHAGDDRTVQQFGQRERFVQGGNAPRSPPEPVTARSMVVKGRAIGAMVHLRCGGCRPPGRPRGLDSGFGVGLSQRYCGLRASALLRYTGISSPTCGSFSGGGGTP